MYWWYIGARLTDVPALLSFATTDFAYPYAYVKNTAHSYMAELEKKIRTAGGEILYNTTVTKIVAKDRQVVGVETNQGDFFPCNHVVSTIDPKIAVGKLLEGDDAFKEKVIKKEKGFKENFSFFMVYLPENVLLFAESARTAEKVLDAASRSKGFQVPRELKGTLRAVCRMSTPIAGIPSQMSGSLALTGIKKDNLRGFFKAVCASADDAAQLLMQANMLINFAVSSWFQNDYQLGSRLVSALHFAADKEIVTLKFDLSQELLEKITAYSEKQAKEVVEQKKREKALPARGMNAN